MDSLLVGGDEQGVSPPPPTPTSRPDADAHPIVALSQWQEWIPEWLVSWHKTWQWPGTLNTFDIDWNGVYDSWSIRVARRVGERGTNVFNALWEQIVEMYMRTSPLNLLIGIAVVSTLITIITVVGAWRQQQTIKQQKTKHVKKRDIVKFWMKKAMRKAGKKALHVPFPRRHKRVIANVTKGFARLAAGRDRRNPLPKRDNTPTKLLEAGQSASDTQSQLPPHIRHILNTLRFFGHLDDAIVAAVLKQLDTISLHKDQFLFNIGNEDDAIYVVNSGRLRLTITDPALQHGEHPNKVTIKCLEAGESIAPMLSLVEYLSGKGSTYVSVEARAEVDKTEVIRIPFSAFQSTTENHLLYLQLVRVVAMRLQRVTFVALNEFLGLHAELGKKKPIAEPCESYSEITEKIFSDHDLYNASLKSVCECMTSTLQAEHLAETVAASSSFALFKAGDEIIVQGDRGSDLFYVVKGSCVVGIVDKASSPSASTTAPGSGTQPMPGAPDFQRVVDVLPGEFTGELAVLSNVESFITVRAREDSILLKITRANVMAYLRTPESVKLLNVLVQSMLKTISPLVRQIDFAIDWLHMHAGSVLYRQGHFAENLYIVLSGRVRSVAQRKDGTKKFLREYGRHELVGDFEVLTNTPWHSSTHAIRDSELAKVPSGLLDLIKQKHPETAVHLMSAMSDRVVQMIHGGGEDSQRNNSLSTVCLLPVSPEVPLSAFASTLKRSLRLYGPTLHLSNSNIEEKFGHCADDIRGPIESEFVSWVSAEEDKNDTIIFEADPTMTQWTSRCMRQADVILVIGIASGPKDVGELEKKIEIVCGSAQVELVLLHEVDVRSPRGTAEWLNLRPWCSRHHHIRCPETVLESTSSKRASLLDRILDTSAIDDVFGDGNEQKRPIKIEGEDESGDETAELQTESQDPHVNVEDYTCFLSNPELNHFGRLARHLRGISIGLVLGGGGARGLAHAGVIQKLTEAGVPIDMVGGTSIGSFVGALYCDEDGNTLRIEKRLRAAAKSLGNKWNLIFDLTWPIMALMSGAAFNRVIRGVFGSRQIEDLWLPYFCVSTDITASGKAIHRTGCLWRYVRASMSLSGYLPPICDPDNGHLLLDGGYCDIVPIEPMKQAGADTIFAVDVAVVDQTKFDNYGDSMSGFNFVLKKLNPFMRTPQVPGSADIASSLAFISANKVLMEIQRRATDVEYVHPNVTGYGTLEWDKAEEIYQLGLKAMESRAQEFKRQWAKQNHYGGRIRTEQTHRSRTQSASSFVSVLDTIATDHDSFVR
eukprot:m.343654 g.343654  ORF g.343654 m.343654 type:complete len:1274 (+) comp16131_c0_seq4:4039-7860(+)